MHIWIVSLMRNKRSRQIIICCCCNYFFLISHSRCTKIKCEKKRIFTYEYNDENVIAIHTHRGIWRHKLFKFCFNNLIKRSMREYGHTDWAFTTIFFSPYKFDHHHFTSRHIKKIKTHWCGVSFGAEWQRLANDMWFLGLCSRFCFSRRRYKIYILATLINLF